MKILIINWQDIRNPFAGGAEVHLHEVFSRIAQAGHEVTLYCSTFPGAAGEETIDGIRVIREGGRDLFNYRVPLAYLRRLSRQGFDIVIDDMNKIPFFTPLYVREPLYGITHHLFDTSIFRETNVLVAIYVYLMEQAAVWLYRLKGIPFIVGSPSTQTEMMAHGFRGDDVTVVNYAVNHALYRRTGVPRSPTPLIGYIGRLKKYKSIEQLLRALPAVLAQVPDLRLVVIGEGDDRGRLESISRALGLASTVEFTGYVTDEKKVELLQHIWFKVTTSSKEGWGLTVLEANACGTAVIASNVQGLRDAVKDGETGLLYTYGDVKELAQKIIQLVRDESLRDSLSANAVRWAQSFTWDVAAERTLALLEKRRQPLHVLL
jgi:glycosyltransferase involved in cell wall biosynthesis